MRMKPVHKVWRTGENTMFVSLVSPPKPQRTACVCVVLLLAVTSLLAQQDSGTIVGTVFDPAGAVVPGVINVGTNLTTTLTTDQNEALASLTAAFGSETRHLAPKSQTRRNRAS